eukprot:NODE_2657_length_887_cov_47.441527_g2187_i0.p2 GENE.NODE_2657_length_887_cov_47.441527_g2187_i0~~NODE_2657_length_887_cov_47.441527_g2187_i0.p2  ORF type:complete len:61 (-),score=1.88 NODE_2657_length_887_cov_47.441527_g2187_i0:447-629(-)
MQFCGKLARILGWGTMLSQAFFLPEIVLRAIDAIIFSTHLRYDLEKISSASVPLPQQDCP